MNENLILPAICVVGYNRIESICRVLDSVINADYTYDGIQLIVSLDHSDLEEKMTEAVNKKLKNWKNGKSEIRTYDNRLGLRKHILKCGDISSEYGAVIVLEDDIVVSPYFYNYTVQALNYYQDDLHIAGIALYSHKWNGYARRFFEPLNNGNDNYFGQFSVTWGQCWSAEQWKRFRKWYGKNSNKLSHMDGVPDVITNWPDSSWGKYFVHYIVENDLYYVMPYVSLSTNFGDVGQHIKSFSSEHQVPLEYGKRAYDFADYPNGVKYDIFFESMDLAKKVSEKYNIENICIDLYGQKEKYKEKYVITTKKLDYKIVDSYGMLMSPVELNILYDVKGQDIFLYDISKKEPNKVVMTRHRYNLINYDIKYLSFKESITYCVSRFKISLGEIWSSMRKKK